MLIKIHSAQRAFCIEKWNNWTGDNSGSFGYHWSIPGDFGEATSLAYDIYKSIAEKNDEELRLLFPLFRQANMNDNIHKFNQSFLAYYINALEDIISSQEIDNIIRKDFVMGNKVFIVHGHDNEMKREVQLLYQEQSWRMLFYMSNLIGEE